MTDQEVLEMQRRIDDGIRLAHKRLWERAGSMCQTLVVSREGKIVEMVPDGNSQIVVDRAGDPLARRNNR